MASFALHGLGETEVEHLHRAVGFDLDVGRLQIAVHDAGVVCRLERQRDLPGHWQRVVEWHGTARDSRGQILAVDELHGVLKSRSRSSASE